MKLETSSVPELRVEARNTRPVHVAGEYVLYWMIAARRVNYHFGLQRAIDWAKHLDSPLVILEALRVGYRWASDRLHRFVLDGMVDNERALRSKPVRYYPYVEPRPDAGKGLLAALARRASLVVTDLYPCEFVPRMVRAAADQVPVLLEQVDSNGLLPLRAAAEVFPTALAFRRFLQKNLRPHLTETPRPDPLEGVRLPRLKDLPAEVVKRWPPAKLGEIDLAALPIDHTVGPALVRGGSRAAAARLDAFLSERLAGYLDNATHPDDDCRSGFSPYLRFGHLATHEVFHRILEREGWTPRRLGVRANGKREGWWGAEPATEAFLDELITWRELGYNMCHRREDYDRYESLPDWARRTLEKHALDPRPHCYDLDEFALARTHDPVWNAAQTQLVREGRIHNYLRMLWGKKILEWTRSPREALDVMIELNNRFAVDGRDPNSYSGVFWVLGRYDRPWGPERPIFGVVRYMSSTNTIRKLRVKEYLKRYGSI